MSRHKEPADGKSIGRYAGSRREKKGRRPGPSPCKRHLKKRGTPSLEVLENELHSESQLPILAKVKAGILEGAGPNTRRPVFREGIRHSKVPVIQDVLCLDSELKLSPLSN